MKKWCIKVTEENLPIVGEWFNVNKQNLISNFINSSLIGYYYHYPILDDNFHVDRVIQDGYTELTFEQFKEQILKEPNQLQEILDKIKSNSYCCEHQGMMIVDLDDIEQIFSNYLNK